MKIEELAIEDIKIDGRYREDLGNIEALAASIGAKGILQPIIVDVDRNLLAGGRRVAAASKAGLVSVPAVTYKSSDDLDALEVELLENIERKDMTWVERAKLEARIYELHVKKDPKWGKRAQARLLGQSDGSTRRRLQLAYLVDKMPELAKCRTQDEAWKKFQRLSEDVVIEQLKKSASGAMKDAAKWAADHYHIGNFEDSIKKVKNGIANFAEVDPPYGIDLTRRKSRGKDSYKIDKYNEVSSKDYKYKLTIWANETYRCLADNSFCIWWYGPTWYGEVRQILRDVGFSVNDIPGIWYKVESSGQTASPDTMLASVYEPFFVARKGKPVMRTPGKLNVFPVKPTLPSLKIHATEKPIALLEQMLDIFCFPGANILVPFLGSGVTLRAAYKKNMVGWGYDLDEAIKRKFLGKVQKDKMEKDDG